MKPLKSLSVYSREMVLVAFVQTAANLIIQNYIVEENRKKAIGGGINK
jgi:hypothetical protein